MSAAHSHRVLAAVLAAFSLTAIASCEKAKTVEVSGPPSSFSGTWRWVCCTGKLTGTLSLTQKGTDVTGELRGPGDESRVVHGTVDGTMLRFTGGSGPNEQRYTLQVDASGEAMRGAFEGEHDPAADTDFVAHRVARGIGDESK